MADDSGEASADPGLDVLLRGAIQQEFEKLGRQLRLDICAELQASLKGEQHCERPQPTSTENEGALPVLLSHPLAATSPASVFPPPPVLPSTSRTTVTTARSREPHSWTQRHRRSFLGMQHARHLIELEWLDGPTRSWTAAWQHVRTGLARLTRPRGAAPGDDVRLVEKRARPDPRGGCDAASSVSVAPEAGSPKQDAAKGQGPMFTKAGSARSMQKVRTGRVMGLTPSRTVDDLVPGAPEGCGQVAARSLVKNPIFEFFIQVIIIINAVVVGLQTDLMADDLSLDVPVRHKVFNLVFCGIFATEVALRLYAYRKRFFTMWGCGWNIFDLVLVVVQVFEEILLMLGSSTGVIAHHVGWPNNTLIRVARILRVIKVVRVVRVMRYFEDLRLLVICILHSARPFFWAAALIMVIIYVVGTYLTHIVLVHRIVDGLEPADSMELDEYYGTVSRSVLSLFQGLTGGVDWRDLLMPLLDHPPLRWAAAGFLAYLAFSILGVMNVVTGTFVQHAIERSQEVKELNKVSMARKLFKSLDLDASGSITFEEIQHHVHTPAVQEFLESIDVDISEARCLFEVIDMGGSGSIDFEEFLHGCLRLQGPARALDLLLLTRDSRRFFEQQAELLQQLIANSPVLPPSHPGPPDTASAGGYDLDFPGTYASALRPPLPPAMLEEDEC